LEITGRWSNGKTAASKPANWGSIPRRSANFKRQDSLRGGSVAKYNVIDFGAKCDGVADDTAVIQQAIDFAKNNGGGQVYVPEGKYLITDTLNIYSKVRLTLDEEATIVRGGTFANMIRPIENPATGYNGEHDFIIEGGIWDFNGSAYPVAGTAITFGHCKNVTVQNLKVLNVYENHCIEINSSYNVKVKDCIFDTQVGTRQSEAIQLDGAFRATVFPPYGEYDYTTCQNVSIEGCTFLNWSRGIGSHTYEAGYYHKDIRIINNHFEGMYDDGIRTYGYQYATIQGNTFAGCANGITVEYSQYCTIIGNVIRGSKNNGINLYNEASNNAVIGNIVVDSEDQGISLYNKSNANVINGNNIVSNGNFGIVINGCNSNSVVGNLLGNNGTDGYEGLKILNASSYNNVQTNRIFGPYTDVADTSGKPNNVTDNY
jgi:parallel beta-helix repeat protein